MINYSLYIDDVRTPKGKFSVIARSADEAITIMHMNGCPHMISFDHDLADGKDAVYIVNWMINEDLNHNGEFIPPDFVFNIHSANPVGAKNIEGKLNGYLNHGRKQF